MPTIKDIARDCGVSANTVSCVLNNKPGEVSSFTKARVLESMRRLGYRPNAAARRMVGRRTNTIGIADRYVHTNDQDPFKAQLLEPIIHAVRAGQRDLLYYSGHVDDGGYTSFLDGRSDGLICISGNIDQYEVSAMLQSDLPIVFIGTAHERPGNRRGATVDIDNETGAYLAVSHLAQLGHKKIAMLQGVGISGNEQRVAGYRRALIENGISFQNELLVPTIAWDKSGYDETVRILSQPEDERPTAIFYFNDVLAYAGLRAAADLGVAVPEQLSIVGFDDLTMSAIVTPALTTVRQPFDWIGRRAVEILVGIIEGKFSRDHSEVVQPALTVRASTARAPIA